jgi:hypothetical protein
MALKNHTRFFGGSTFPQHMMGCSKNGAPHAFADPPFMARRSDSPQSATGNVEEQRHKSCHWQQHYRKQSHADVATQFSLGFTPHLADHGVKQGEDTQWHGHEHPWRGEKNLWWLKSHIKRDPKKETMNNRNANPQQSHVPSVVRKRGCICGRFNGTALWARRFHAVQTTLGIATNTKHLVEGKVRVVCILHQ